MPEPLEIRGVRWPEIEPGADLAALIAVIDDLRDGDIVVVTSKVVAKAEGRTVHLDRAEAVARETRRVVARRGPTVIAETSHGFVMAAAGVDASNTPVGTAVLLPLDPDASARRLRERVYDDRHLNVGVVVSDTAGRAWRTGQTDLAVGCAGLWPLEDLAGTRDSYGNELQVTAPAVADELAGAADLVTGKTSGLPVAVARGLSSRVLPPGEHGPGVVALVRPPAEDLFGLGAREAVAAAAVRSDPLALAHFPRRIALDAEPFDGLLGGWLAELTETSAAQVQAALAEQRCPEMPAGSGTVWALRVAVHKDAGADVLLAVGRLLERADTLAASQRLDSHDHPFEAAPPWRQVARRCWWDG